MSPTRFTRDDLVVGRVISEDSGFMLIELMKNDDDTFNLDSSVANNRFFTLAFVKMEDGKAVIWKPWESE